MDENVLAQFKPVTDCIDPDQPVGSDMRHHDDYDWVVGESCKFSSLHEVQDIDFSKLHEITYTLLTKKTKDLKLFGWWLVAFFKLQPKADMCVLSYVTAKFLEKYAFEGYPKKDKAKLLCIEWIIELWQKALNKDKGTQYSQSVAEKIDTLSAKFKLHFEEKSPSLHYIKQRIESGVKATETNLDEAAVEIIKLTNSSASKETSDTVTQPADNNKEIDSEKEEQKIIRSMQETTGLLVNYWSQNSSLVMNILLLNRASSWAPIKHSPKHINLKTLLKPVPVEKQLHYSDAINKDPSISLLLEIEKSLLKAPFWLTGHVYVVELLHRLQKNTERDMVLRLLVSLLDRLPELKELMFDDGSKFIKVEEVEYIYNFCFLKEPKTSTNTKNQESDMKSLISEALKLYRSGKRKEAYLIFQERIDKEKSKRLRLLYNIAIIELSLFIGKSDIAGYKIKEVDDEFEFFNRSEYEPKIELKLLKLKKQYNALNNKKSNKEEINNIESEICKINVCELI